MPGALLSAEITVKAPLCLVCVELITPHPNASLFKSSGRKDRLSHQHEGDLNVLECAPRLRQ